MIQKVLKGAADWVPTDPEMPRQAATDAGGSLPSASVRPDRRTVMVTVKMLEESAIALAEGAKARTARRRAA